MSQFTSGIGKHFVYDFTIFPLVYLTTNMKVGKVANNFVVQKYQQEFTGFGELSILQFLIINRLEFCWELSHDWHCHISPLPLQILNVHPLTRNHFSCVTRCSRNILFYFWRTLAVDKYLLRPLFELQPPVVALSLCLYIPVCAPRYLVYVSFSVAARAEGWWKRGRRACWFNLNLLICGERPGRPARPQVQTFITTTC